jgi:hypothetical protein
MAASARAGAGRVRRFILQVGCEWSRFIPDSFDPPTHVADYTDNPANAIVSPSGRRDVPWLKTLCCFVLPVL